MGWGLAGEGASVTAWTAPTSLQAKEDNLQLVPLDPMTIKLSLCLEGSGGDWSLSIVRCSLALRPCDSESYGYSDTIKEALVRAAEPTGLGWGRKRCGRRGAVGRSSSLRCSPPTGHPPESAPRKRHLLGGRPHSGLHTRGSLWSPWECPTVIPGLHSCGTLVGKG